ncbi:hypothetical protein BT96DRAFT_840715, partial [Gymnopus androsaceus JB14]
KATRYSHAHQVAFSASERLDERILQVHHQILVNRNHPISIAKFLQESPQDPAKRNFYPKLQDHLLTCILGKEFDGDEEEYTDEDRNTIRLSNGKIFAVRTLRINYTTYNVRWDYELINPRTDHCMVMV